MLIRSRKVDLASFSAVLALLFLASAAGNPSEYMVTGYLNVSQPWIMNDGSHKISVSYDIVTNYPADKYYVLINKNGSLDNASTFQIAGPMPLEEGRAKGSPVVLSVDKTWKPNNDYLAHLQFKSSGGELDAGLYQRFAVYAFGYLNIFKFNDLNGNGRWDNGEPLQPGYKFTTIAPSPLNPQETIKLENITDYLGKINLLNGPVPSGNYYITDDMKHYPESHWNHTGTEIKGNATTLPSNGEYNNVLVPVDYYQTVSVYFGDKLANSTLTLNAFYDYNGDRSQSGKLEPGIPGLKFTVVGGPENKKYEIATNADGTFVLTDLLTSEKGAVYHINESLPNDKWECTTSPLEMDVILMPGDNKFVSFGNRLKPATIGITKFRDYNGNGKRESNEPGLPWKFLINGSDGTRDNKSTDNNGRLDYQVDFPMPSPLDSLPTTSFYISEIQKSGWNLTTPLPKMPIVVGPGSNVQVPAFGNYLIQRIHILKFNDTNNNSIRDSGELGIHNWSFQIDDSSGRPVVKKTDSYGKITIFAKPNTRYTVSEYLQPEWRPTNATEQIIKTDWDTSDFYVNFGNFRPPPIIVTKFEDANNNSKWDAGEQTLAGWEFDVTGPINDPRNNTVRVKTGENGDVRYLCPAPGRYIVKEIENNGCWICTTNDTVSVSVLEGQTVHLVFGNYDIRHHTAATAFENPDIIVQKAVDPSQLTTDMIGNCGDTYLRYTIQIIPKEKALATDLVIAMNDMVPNTPDSQGTIDAMVNGVSGFLDNQAAKSNTSSRVGLIRWIGTESNEIYPNANYTDLSNDVKNSQFIQTNMTSAFADWTLGIADKFYKLSPTNTKKILVLITDSRSPLSIPTETLNASYTIHAIVIGGEETNTTRLLRNLTSEHHGKLYTANDSAEMQYALDELALVTRPAILKNVQLVDTVPSYLEPVDYLVNPPKPENITANNDGIDWHTTSLKWWIGNLSSGRPWNTSFAVRFCWVVPADIHQADVVPRVSQVYYTREDGSMAAIQVPEGAISIVKSGTLAPRSTPGFQALISLAGLLAIAYLWKRR